MFQQAALAVREIGIDDEARPQWKWEDMTMNFIIGLPKSFRGNDSIWVIVDRFSKTAHFLAMKKKQSVESLARLYVENIVKLHGVPKSIISDRDPRFTSRLWQGLQNAFESQLKLSSAYHHQTDGQSERTIWALEDMMRTCILE